MDLYSSFTVEFRSSLQASAEQLWDHASSMEGVNRELAPWVHMTVPEIARGKRLADVVPGEEAFRSVLLAFGVLPFDVHHLTIERMLDHGFIEESWSWLQRRWRHERRVVTELSGSGCTLTDRVTVVPRAAPRWVVEPMVRRVFAARHSYLRAHFGASTAGA